MIMITTGTWHAWIEITPENLHVERGVLRSLQVLLVTAVQPRMRLLLELVPGLHLGLPPG